MLKCVEGIYKEGKVELLEIPDFVGESRVLVTFLETEHGDRKSSDRKRGIYYGMFAGPNMSTEEDFKIAEWHGDALDDDGNEAHR